MNAATLEVTKRPSPRDLKGFLNRGERFQLVDVRSPGEFDGGHVPGALNVPLEHVEARLGDLHPSDPVVLICHSGRRAEMARELLKHHRDHLLVLDGGTKAWTDEGLPTVHTATTRLPLMRQVQLVAGPLVVAGSLLGRFANPSWAFLATFVGAGLTLAGATGFCGMANLLARMPWNQGRRPAACGTNTRCVN